MLIHLFFSIRFYGPIPIALLRGRVFAKVVGSIPPIRYVPSDPDVILNANKIKWSKMKGNGEWSCIVWNKSNIKNWRKLHLKIDCDDIVSL